MASYSEWNDAIADFFTERTRAGDMFHLAVDEDALSEIAESPSLTIRPNAVDDFERAVRNRGVSQGSVRLPSVRRSRKTNAPGCVAFLAAMSLAAHRMAPDDDIGENNYFTRLREILGLSTAEQGRPEGMLKPGVEERLWTALNKWALENGWRPSAERGEAVATRYINYPLSQALLRDGDKGRLESAFRQAERQLTRYADRERVAAWFFNNDAGFSTNHLTNLAQDSERFDSVVDAVYDVYDSIDWDSRPDAEGTTSSRRARSKTLLAGLYRESDPLFGEVSYLLYPRRRAQNISGLGVVRDGGTEPLHQDGDGGFPPLWEVDPAGGKSWRVSGSDAISELRLPPRDFWVLTRDGFGDESGDFASRGSPQLGETFILLCRDGVANEMRRLRDNGLVKWEGEPEKVSDGWVEFRECEARSGDWSYAVSNSDLSNELRPQSRASISLQGGLKAAGRGSWIEGYAPTYSVASLDDCRARLFSASRLGAKPVMDNEAAPNFTPTDLPKLKPDDYWLEISVNGKRAARRFFRIVSWDSLTPAKPSNPFGTRIGDSTLRGALLIPAESVNAR